MLQMSALLVYWPLITSGAIEYRVPTLERALKAPINGAFMCVRNSKGCRDYKMRNRSVPFVAQIKGVETNK